MRKIPCFSVLMSVYRKDNPAWLEQAINSLLDQSAKPAEIIVMADGPLTQQLDAVLAKYANDINLIRLPKNAGLGAALHDGLLYCTHDLVARMDSDDFALPNRFEKQLARFAQQPDLAVLGGAIEEVNSDTFQPVAIRRVPLEDTEIKQFLRSRCPFNHMTVMFRKKAVLDAGNYQPFHLMEDYYLWARLAAKGYKMANLPDIVLKARVDANMYARRGGWKYFKSNKALSAKLYELGLISLPRHYFNVVIRCCVQVLMPNVVRSIFYKKALR